MFQKYPFITFLGVINEADENKYNLLPSFKYLETIYFVCELINRCRFTSKKKAVSNFCNYQILSRHLSKKHFIKSQKQVSHYH